MTTTPSSQGREGIPLIKIDRYSSETIYAQPPMMNVFKLLKQKSKPSAAQVFEEVSNSLDNLTKHTELHYISNIFSGVDGADSLSAKDASIESEFINGQYNKSKVEDSVVCPYCSYIAHSSVLLEYHVSHVHGKDVTYKCKVCNFTCKWNREYYLHMKTHYQGPPFQCESCGFACSSIQFLLSHRINHLIGHPFKWDECSRRAKLNFYCCMSNTGQKTYQYCEHCLATKESLDHYLECNRYAHLSSRMHFDAGCVFHCYFPNCKFSTRKKTQLKSHHRTHTAMRRHLCSICGRAFIEKSHLVRHERIHLNEKPFKCESCEYSSSRRDKLKEHFQKHHGENATAKGPYRPRKQKYL